MKISKYIPIVIILFIILLSIIAISFLHNSNGNSLIFFLLYLSFIVIIESLSILTVVYIFYDKPIRKLEYTIKKFLVGSLKEGDLHFKKTLNPHLNYTLLFFSKTLNTLRHIKSEFIHGKEIKSEVDLAWEIQDKLLHKKIPQVPELEIIARSKPAWEIGGDSFDVIKQGENYYIYVWDATGHWVGAGFIMMMTNALVSGFAKVTNKWNHILALTNDIIKPRVKANLLMSVLLLRWNAEEQRIYMTWAGHEYLMIYKHAQKKCFKIKSGWVALWMAKNIHKLIKEREISFEPNDIIVLYSDGITEAINQSKKDGNESMFGEEALLRAIEDTPDIHGGDIKTARGVFKNISIALSQFMWYKHAQLDDVTLLTIQYTSADYKKEDDCSEDMDEDFITEWKW